MNIKSLFAVSLGAALALSSPRVAASATPALNPEADRRLLTACNLLAAAKTFTVRAEVWEDFVSAGHKVSVTRLIDAQVRRPNRLQLEVRSSQDSHGYWYDGKVLTLLDRVNNLYGSTAAPDNLEKLLDAARERFGINFPLEDLLVNDPYASARAGIKESAYFGQEVILGVPCHHLAFSTPVVDWQIWIQDGERPLPRKLVITYKQEETAPQFTAIFSDWKLNSDLPENTFRFEPQPAAAKIEILPVDEVPASVPPQTSSHP